jgi:hypothetical protein
LKRISEELDGNVDVTRRKLLEPLPQVVKLEEDGLQFLKELYEKVDWAGGITDEVVDALDFLMGSSQEEE